MLPPMQVRILKSRASAPQLSRKHLFRAAMNELRRRGPMLPNVQPPAAQAPLPRAPTAALPSAPELSRAADVAIGRLEVKVVQVLTSFLGLLGLS
mmetsp:Transcript_36303/g.73150  ORF Transcript_36303/g.73150 Transcript_36303/m.73150 type:complete len:95 (-) Transcript_36303:171-455(-)